MYKCTDKLIEQVRPLVEANLSWGKIAKAVEVSRDSLHAYRTKGNPSYSEAFAKMIEEAQEELVNKTKSGQLDQSVVHTLKKSLWEYRTVDVRSLDRKEKKSANVQSVEKSEKRTRAKMSPPPEMPPTWLTQPYLIDYADQVLDIELVPWATVPEMRAECLLRVKELTVNVRVRIESEQEVDPSAKSVENVLKNMGIKDERWSFKEEHEHGLTNNTLLDIAARMCGKGGKKQQ